MPHLPLFFQRLRMRLSPEGGMPAGSAGFLQRRGRRARAGRCPAFPRCFPVAVQSSTGRASLSRRATDFRLRAARDAGGGIFGTGRWRSRPSAATLRNHRAPGRKRQGCCRRFSPRSGHRHVNGTRGCRRYREGSARRAALGTPCGVKGGRGGSAEPWEAGLPGPGGTGGTGRCAQAGLPAMPEKHPGPCRGWRGAGRTKGAPGRKVTRQRVKAHKGRGRTSRPNGR